MNLQDIQSRLADISVDVEALIEIAGDKPNCRASRTDPSTQPRGSGNLRQSTMKRRNLRRQKLRSLHGVSLQRRQRTHQRLVFSQVFRKTSPRKKTKWQFQPKLDTQSHDTSTTTKMPMSLVCSLLLSAGTRRLRTSWPHSL